MIPTYSVPHAREYLVTGPDAIRRISEHIVILSGPVVTVYRHPDGTNMPLIYGPDDHIELHLLGCSCDGCS